MRQLDVWLNQRRVGTVREGDDLWHFEYAEEWSSATDSFALAPSLPTSAPMHVDGATDRAVQWYFDNLLPEEGLRTLLLAKAGIKGGDDAFALLAYLGQESAGSLSLLEPGSPAPSGGGRRPLSDDELSARIRNLAREPLSTGAPKRMSLAGAQNKLPVIYVDGELFEPVGNEPSTHILKPNHTSDDYAGSVMNEFFTMTLAHRVGLPVPRVYRRYVPEPVYIIERFDRFVDDAGGTQRRHIIDACQLLNKSRVFKASARLETLKDLAEACRNRVLARLQIFRWLVFCALVGNDDNHLKNLSFYVSAEGVAPASHYDLLSTATYRTRAFADERAVWPSVPLMVELAGARVFGDITRDSLVSAGGVLGLAAVPANRVIDELRTAVGREVAGLAGELDGDYDEHPKARPEDRNLEGRVIRTIFRVTIRDMLERLA